MGLLILPSGKANGQILYAEDLAAITNALLSYFNSGQLGNINFTTDPSQRLSASKIVFDTASHGTTHEPGGVDKVKDIDLGGSGIKATLHASRHADGASDPIQALSLTGAMFKDATFSESKNRRRRDMVANLLSILNLTANPLPVQQYALGVAGAKPTGNGVVRSGKVYFATPGTSPESVTSIDFSTDPPTEVQINLTAGDKPGGLALIGTDIYVLTGVADTVANCKIRKIDLNNTVTLLVDVNDAASPAPTNLRDGVGLSRDYAGAALFLVAEATTESNAHVLARVPLAAGAAAISKFNAGTAHLFGQPWVVKRGTVERVVLVDGLAAGSVVYRRNASDLAAVDTFNLAGADARQSSVYDGSYLLTINAAMATIRIVDVWASTMFEVANYAAPPGGPGTLDTAETTGFGPYFDGQAAFFAGRNAGAPRGTFMRVPVPNYGGGLVLALRDDSSHVRGFASDAQFLYVATVGPADGTAKIIRVPMF